MTEQDDRYARQLRLPGFGPVQQARLGAARVAVIGAGGLGSPVLEYLAAAGAGRAADGGWITVIDADVVDTSNLHRQVIHASGAVGRPKAESAAERMRAINPEVDVRPRVEVLDVTNALDVLAGHGLVIDGTDNFPTRYLASDACEMLDVPLVWGSILAFAGQVSVFAADGGRGVTYRDVHPVPPGPGEVPNCAEAGVLGMLCGVIGSAMALEAVKEITGVGRSLRGRIALFDALAMRWDELPVARDPGRAPVTELEDLTVTCGLPGAAPGAPTLRRPFDVPPVEVAAMLAQGRRVIDVREDREVAAGMLAGAEHIPSGTLLGDPDGAGELEGAILYCAAGVRSEAARRALAARGVQVLSVPGGFAALQEAGAPLIVPGRTA